MDPILIAVLWAILWGVVAFVAAKFFVDDRLAKLIGLIVALFVFLGRV